MSELLSALQLIDVPVWVPRVADDVPVAACPEQADGASEFNCTVHYQGDNPLALLWVDEWHVMAKKLIANVLHFLNVPLKQCVIIGKGESQFELSDTIMASIKLYVGFGGMCADFAEQAVSVPVVNTVSIQQLITAPESKQQLMQDLWPYRLLDHA